MVGAGSVALAAWVGVGDGLKPVRGIVMTVRMRFIGGMRDGKAVVDDNGDGGDDDDDIDDG
jgi:hypothetical protein